ncbi:MAG: DUF302 domain-containing protein [Firmicutes bacterium]|nr:DUF302 domain-containing protein [Bacillota bacterium]
MSATTSVNYKVSTEKPVQEAVLAIEEAAKAQGFGVLNKLDIQQILANKGFDRSPYTLLEVCNPRFASEVLAADPEIGTFLPCPIAVYEEEGKTFLSAMLPTVIATHFEAPSIHETAQEVEKRIQAIVDAAK